MSATAFASTETSSHVEAYCSTGTSPGRAYEISGPPHAPPVVVLGGISASKHLTPTLQDPTPGWWPGVVGPSAALDPYRHRLLGIEYVDAPGDGTAEPPVPISTHDQACALRDVLDDAGLGRVTLVGASYGGMVALAFASLFPERTNQLVVLCAAHRTHPMATAWRALQRSTVRFGVEVGRPREGLALARGLAMTTYRSATEFDQRFDSRASTDGQELRFPVESYIEARGKDFSERFDAPSFLKLSESIDAHFVDPATVSARCTLVSFDSDVLVPSWLVDELAAGLAGPSRHVRISTVFGHDAFLKEVREVSKAIEAALTEHCDRGRRGGER